jgi:hypothetical protein
MSSPSTVEQQDLDLSKFDGPRMHRFKASFTQTINEVIDHVDVKQILDVLDVSFAKEHHGNIYKFLNKNNTILREILMVFVIKIKFESNRPQKEFEALVREKNVRKKLNALDLHVRLDDSTTLYVFLNA